MENQIQVIQHQKFGKIRVVVFNGMINFVGKDVATSLGFKDTDKAIRRHVQKQDKTFVKPSDFKDTRQVRIDIPRAGFVIINESGLWSLVMHSKLPMAREFQHWITSEVIPAIMRTGSYQMSGYNSSAFTDREKVEMLFKMLNLASTPALKNQLIRHIDFILTMDFYNIAVNE